MPLVSAVSSDRLLVRQKPTGFLRDFDFSLNPYAGCAFACGGCYVPALLCGQAQRKGGWGRYVEARVRAVDALRRRRDELAGASWFMSPATDVYQPAERRFRLTRAILAELLQVPFAWGLISTRSPAVLDDVDLLIRLRDRVEVGISLPTDREEIRRRMDRLNPPAHARLDAARRLREAGVFTRLHVAPIQPHSDRFPHLAGEVADWIWIDHPAHLSIARPAYESGGIAFALGREWVQEQVERWRAVLGAERVGYGQADFGRQFGRAARGNGGQG